MRIFLAFLQSPVKHPIPAYGFWEYYIKKGVEEAGFEWTECPTVDWALGLVPQTVQARKRWQQEAWEKTVNFLKANHVDLFLSYLYPEQIDVTAIRQLQKAGIPCVNFFCDNVRQFNTTPAEFGVFDLNWVPEYKAIKQYQKAGYPYIHLPMPMWIRPECRNLQPEINEEITFIGSKDLQRHLLFEDLTKLNPKLPLSIYGNGWLNEPNGVDNGTTSSYGLFKKLSYQLKFLQENGLKAYSRKLKARSYNSIQSDLLSSKLHQPPDNHDYEKLTSSSMITLGVNRYPSFRHPVDRPDTYSRLRDIEAPMLGACYLTEFTEGIDDLYDINNEIATYKNAEELLQQINRLQNDKQLRTKLKTQGQKKALSQHAIPASLAKIIATLGLK